MALPARVERETLELVRACPMAMAMATVTVTAMAA